MAKHVIIAKAKFDYNAMGIFLKFMKASRVKAEKAVGSSARPSATEEWLDVGGLTSD